MAGFELERDCIITATSKLVYSETCKDFIIAGVRIVDEAFPGSFQTSCGKLKQNPKRT